MALMVSLIYTTIASPPSTRTGREAYFILYFMEADHQQKYRHLTTDSLHSQLVELNVTHHDTTFLPDIAFQANLQAKTT